MLWVELDTKDPDVLQSSIVIIQHGAQFQIRSLANLEADRMVEFFDCDIIESLRCTTERLEV